MEDQKSRTNDKLAALVDEYDELTLDNRKNAYIQKTCLVQSSK